MLWNYQHLVADEMGAPDGVLMLDETGFVKKGRDSVGGARQYCGTLGKVENCQVGVFAAYASRRGYALVAKRLLLSEVWCTDAYKPVVGEYRRRRRRDGLREDVARRDGAVPRISAPAPGDAVAARECLSPRPVHTLGSAAAP